MSNIFADALEFVHDSGIPAQDWVTPDVVLEDNLHKIIKSEVTELVEADTEVDTLDALIDIIYATATAAIRLGFTEFELQAAWEEIHRSNMTKTIDPQIVGGKLQKGPHYEAPDLEAVLEQSLVGDMAEYDCE